MQKRPNTVEVKLWGESDTRRFENVEIESEFDRDRLYESLARNEYLGPPIKALIVRDRVNVVASFPGSTVEWWEEEIHVGVMGLDTATILLCDPGYVGDEMTPDTLYGADGMPKRQIMYANGRPGAGVTVCTGSDGLYDIYETRFNGELSAVRIEGQPWQSRPNLRLVKPADGDGDAAA